MPKGHGVPEILKEEVLAMFRAEIPVRDITMETGVSVPTIYKILRQAGLMDQGVLPRHVQGMDPGSIDDIIQTYLKTTIPVVEIITQFGISHSDLYAILKEAEIPIRSVEQKRVAESDMDKAIAMYTDPNELFPLWDIEAQTGVAAQRLNRRLHQLGIPLRRPRGRYKTMRLRLEDGAVPGALPVAQPNLDELIGVASVPREDIGHE